MHLITIEDLAKLIKQHQLDQFIHDLISTLKTDFSRWHEFTKAPRHAAHVKDGVIELMPIYDDEYYAFKYVNGHPKNPSLGKATVVAMGALADIATGYPLLLSEMTLLTALRTAATSALATDLMAKPNAKHLLIIGTGAQSELQVRATHLVRSLESVSYYDPDEKAMQRFATHLANQPYELIACKSLAETVAASDIIITSTAAKQHAAIIESDWVQAGTHLVGLGGDCPGKTELPIALLERARIAIEYWPQSSQEGEIQQLSAAQTKQLVCGELWELITQKKLAREHDDEITLFDSVGFALEDFSVLRLVYDLIHCYQVGKTSLLIPDNDDPKNLYSLLCN